METRTLGRTGHASTVAILGGAAFWSGVPEQADRWFHAALDAGVNHLDIAPQYGDAQRAVGPHVPAVRDRLFVACKSYRANGDGFRAQLEESLVLLGCDRFDLHQLHAVTSLDELERRIEGGAVQRLLEARDEGLTRFVGVTGHDLGAPAAHAEAIRRFDLDTVMFPVNARLWAEPRYRRDAEALLELASERNVGVMAIKAVARRPWPEGVERHAGTWYEPWTEAGDIARGVDFTLSTPGVHAFCTPGDTTLLPLALDAAARHTPLDERARDQAMAAAMVDPVLTSPG